MAANAKREIEAAEKIALAAARAGGRVYYVGGCVRDALLGLPVKDVDIEVHGIPPETLSEILDGCGEKITIGKSFGVFGLKGLSLDIAMPRTERPTGKGHRDFAIFVDPFLGIEKAAARRDFTVNAILKDVLSGEIADPFGGRDDLEKKILRRVSEKSFAEDELRVLRGAQFAARFGFSTSPETMNLYKTIDLKDLPRERVEGEMKKALLGAEKPSVFFEVLREAGKLTDWFPELEATIGVGQNPLHHAEGDVWTHTLLVLDLCAGTRERAIFPYGLLCAALTHDLGKAVTTEIVNGQTHSYGHEEVGVPLAEAFISRLTGEERLKKVVSNHTLLHMKPNIIASANAPVKKTNKLFDESLIPEDLILLSEADAKGSVGLKVNDHHTPFLEERLRVYREMMERPHVTGKDLIEAGLRPGEDLKETLAYAHKLRLAGIEKNEALRAAVRFSEKREKKNAKTIGKKPES